MWFLIITLALDSATVRRMAVAPAETLTVTIAGAGTPVVLVPGLFGAAYGFRHIIPQLTASGRQVIVIEPLGVGRSGRPRRSDYSLDAQAGRIAHVLDELAVGDAVLVGHGIGAAMLMRVAVERPDLSAALISIEGGPAETAASPSLRRGLEFAPLIRLAGGMRLVRRAVRNGLLRSSGDTSWVSDGLIAEYTAGAAADLGATLLAYMRMAEARERAPLAPRLSAIRCPFRLLIGAAPHASGPGAGDIALLRSSVPHLEVRSIAGAGHYLHEEAAADVARSIIDARTVVRLGGL